MPQCTYCKSRPAYRLIDREVLLCNTCRVLHHHRCWQLLALRWLVHRPEDWMDDVAEFLRTSGPEGTPLSVD